MKRKVLFAIVLGLLLLGCSPKTQAQFTGEDFKLTIGKVPSDVCYRNNVPVVLSANTESDGGYSIVYVRNNGDIVIHQWIPGAVISSDLNDSGEVSWSGGKCN